MRRLERTQRFDVSGEIIFIETDVPPWKIESTKRMAAHRMKIRVLVMKHDAPGLQDTAHLAEGRFQVAYVLENLVGVDKIKLLISK